MPNLHVYKFKQLLLGFVTVSLLVLSAYNLFTYLNRHAIVSAVVLSQSQTSQVYISGAVESPGVYAITKGTSLGEAISMAGGLSPEANAEYLNKDVDLSAEVSGKVFVPFSSLDSVATVDQPISGRVSVNSASLAQLDTLPGIGPSLAQKIIDARPFSVVSDVQNVPGIGEKKYADIAELISL